MTGIHITDMRPVEKRQTWRRIMSEGRCWRFNRYAERVTEDRSTPSAK